MSKIKWQQLTCKIILWTSLHFKTLEFPGFPENPIQPSTKSIGSPRLMQSNTLRFFELSYSNICFVWCSNLHRIIQIQHTLLRFNYMMFKFEVVINNQTENTNQLYFDKSYWSVYRIPNTHMLPITYLHCNH